MTKLSATQSLRFDLNVLVMFLGPQSYLRELIRVMVPKFHTHLEKYSDSKELLFCHRWILL